MSSLLRWNGCVESRSSLYTIRSSRGGTSPAASAASTACPAAFGIFGPINGTVAAGANSSTAAQPPEHASRAKTHLSLLPVLPLALNAESAILLNAVDVAAALQSKIPGVTTGCGHRANLHPYTPSTLPKPHPLRLQLSSVIATTAAYAASQLQQVTAKVGSGLSLTITPFTLSSAKGAELNVNVSYNENAAATISNDQTQANPIDDLNSRVSEHEVNTLVRMDSLKFFEISTMQSVIARARTPWKPFDPVFELPLLDNPGIVIARRKPEVIYNQSIIFMEASIMPTAADLGQGLIFYNDKIAGGVCPKEKDGALPKTAHSAQDFCFDEEKQRSPLDVIVQYHKHMITYFGGQYIGPGGGVNVPAYFLLPSIPPDASASQ